MTWTKVSDDHFDQEPIFSLSRSARLLDLEATVWCNRILTDGHLPAAMLARLGDSPDPQADAAENVATGNWKVHPAGGWQVDWTDQPTAAQVREKRMLDAGKKQRSRARIQQREDLHAQGDHSMCTPEHCRVLQGLTRDVTGESPRDTPRDSPRESPRDSPRESPRDSPRESPRESRRPDPSRTRPDPTRPEGPGEGRGESAPAEKPAPHDRVEASPEQVPNEPVPEDEVADPYLLVGDCLEHNCKGGLDRRIADGQVRCPTCRKEAKAKAKLELDQLRAAAQVESGRAARAASGHRLNGQDETARAEAAAVKQWSVEQDDEEITARHAAAMNGEAPP